MLLLIILASIIPGLLAVVQYFDNNKKEIQSKKDEITLNTKIDSLSLNNQDLKKELNILLKENLKLAHQLTETALKLNENVIGIGDLEIELSIANRQNFGFRFSNNSDLPVINANIIVQDFSEIIKCPIEQETDDKIFIKRSCYNGNFINYPGITINPNGAFNDINKSYPFTNGYMNFNIQIETRKKTIVYHLVYKMIGPEIVCSYRIYNLIKNKKALHFETNPLKLGNEYWEKNFYLKHLYTLD